MSAWIPGIVKSKAVNSAAAAQGALGQANPRIVRLNGAYKGQRITGQQRYAGELSRRLVRVAGIREVSPPRMVAERSVLSWLWALSLPIRLRVDATLVTFTSRGPIVARRHILTVHDLFVLEHPEWYRRGYVLTHAPLLRLQIWLARAIITVSEPVAVQLRSLVRRPDRVFVVPNAPAEVFVSATQAGDDDVLDRHGLNRGAYLLSVGSTDPRKNVARLMRAYGLLAEEVRTKHPLVLVGASHWTFGDVAEVGEAKHLGYVSDEELAALYRGAKAVVFPTLDEGFGLPAVEALACGSALVVSDVPVMRWVCGDAALYVDPIDEASIAAGLEQAIAARESAANVAARVAAASRFSWDSSAAELIRVLDALA